MEKVLIRTDQQEMNRHKYLKQILFGLFLTFLFACNPSTHSDKQVDEPINIFFDEADLGAFGSDTKLFLNARFSECGEWGGHNEKMTIYAKSDKEFYLDYKKFKVNCASIDEYYGTPDFQKLEIEKTLKLNDVNKKSISSYIQRMVKSKVEERHPGHAGNSFSIIKSDSTLIIDVYGGGIFSFDSYNRLLTELNLSINLDNGE